MFILENPYVSDFLLDTLRQNQFEVLENQISNQYKNNYNLNILKEADAINFCKIHKELKIYSNSENSINWVIKHCPNSTQTELINICKNKYEFRKKIAEIYPNFFFKEILLSDIDKIDITNFPKEFIIKPTVGFLSIGVHKVSSHTQWQSIVECIKNETKSFQKHFPKEVLKSSSFIVEEIIKGKEFAIDAYYNNNSEPIILNIFEHPFVSDDDVSDRIYMSSKEIIENNLKPMEELLTQIGKITNMKNFPIHIEVIKTPVGNIIPVEINPMRFAGWCTTDLAYYAYGINMYEYFENNKKPDWNKILNNKDGKIFYFAMAETPQNLDKEKIDFDYNSLKSEFSKILEFRKINYLEKPLFAILFGEAENMQEITKILQLNMFDFIKGKK